METEVPLAGNRIGREGKLLSLTRVFLLLPLLSLPQPSLSSQTPAAQDVNTGILSNLHSDKRVVQSARWFLVREFTIEFAVRGAHQTYCGELMTTDATEAHDLIGSSGQPVAVAERGKDLEIKLDNGRHIKAHRLNPERCPRS